MIGEGNKGEPRLAPITLGGSRFSIRTDASKDYVDRLESYVNEKLAEVQPEGQLLATHNALALAALAIADDFFSAQDERKRIEGEMEQRLKGILSRIDTALDDEE